MIVSPAIWSCQRVVASHTSRSALCRCRSQVQRFCSRSAAFQSSLGCSVKRTRLTNSLHRAEGIHPSLRALFSRRLAISSRPSTNSKAKRSDNPQPVDRPEWVSIVDEPAQLVSANKKHTPGIIILDNYRRLIQTRAHLANRDYVLALIPITAFALGTWQIQRLGWKIELVARFEDRLIKDPLPLPPSIDPRIIPEFDYRRVYTRGRFRHDQEMLVGPRLRDGENGYQVITPLERADSSDGSGSKILVCRGWISKDKKEQSDRDATALPLHEVTVHGLLREPFKKNIFTPDNRPEMNQFYFPDIKEMADLTDSQSVWMEETIEPNIYAVWDKQAKGVPIGRVAEVNLRNNHLQYIFTWYALSFATSIMFWMVFRRPKGGPNGDRVRHSREWA